MAAFTQISESEVPRITVNASQRIAKVDRNIYGGFTEHMGRCIYGGIYDPGNSLSDPKTGYRLDVLKALKELDCPVMRYPGGNFCATYHWIDGVGPKDQRPARPELAWLGTETNQFGTDEFLAWCEELGTEPYFALNFGTGTLDEALGWVEYCNGTGNTYYANLRRKNGREKPYNVKYWALGNEMWGPWQIEQMTQEAYAHKAIQWAKALKLLDPSLILILCGKDGTSSWDYYTLKKCVVPAFSELSSTATHLVDMHSIHLYTASHNHVENALAPLAAERAIEITSSLISLAIAENKIPPTQHRPTICFDEWNVWDASRAEGSKGAEERYTLSDALAVSIWLNVFIRKAADLGMANIAQSVNVISPLMTTKEGIVKQTTWYPLLLFCKYMRGHTLATHLSCPVYEGSTSPEWLRACGKATPWMDVSATVDEEGWVSLVVVNVHEEKGWDVQIDGVKAGVKVQVLLVTGENIAVNNMDGEEKVGVKESEWVVEEKEGAVTYNSPKHSFTMLRWKA